MRNFQSIFERNYLETRNFPIILALQILCHKLEVPKILKSELRVRTQILFRKVAPSFSIGRMTTRNDAFESVSSGEYFHN